MKNLRPITNHQSPNEFNKRHKLRLFLIALVFGIFTFNSYQIFAQGETCLNPIYITPDTSYQTANLSLSGLDDIFLSFNAQQEAVYFVINSSGELPQSVMLYEFDCLSNPIKEVQLFTDSNNIDQLSIYYHNYTIGNDYILQFPQNSAETVESFSVGYFTNSPIFTISTECNLVYNGDFEETLPNAPLGNLNMQIAQSRYWTAPTLQAPNRPDYFHVNSTVSSFQIPTVFAAINNGQQGSISPIVGTNAYAGLFSINHNHTAGGPGEFREWMAVPLKLNLIQGMRYRVEMYVRLASNPFFSYPAKPPGIKFTAEPSIGSTKTINMTQIQITSLTADIQPTQLISNTSNWVKISGIYIASGNENTLTIANFLPNSHTVSSYDSGKKYNSYFLVDGVSVMPLDYCCTNPPPSIEIPDGWTTTDLLNSSIFSSYITGTTFEMPTVVYMNDFTVNSNLTISNSNIKMRDGAEITVNNGNSLTIINSVLKSCDAMWDGIRVVNSNTEVIMDDSEIWHAKKGINSVNGGKYTVSNTLFDGNNNGIYIDAYIGSHQGTVVGSTFKSSEPLKTPYIGQRPYAGIYVNNVADINSSIDLTIGTYMSADKNTFIGPELGTMPYTGVPKPGLQYGIYIDKSSVNIYNNEFLRFERNTSTDTQLKSGIKVHGVFDPYYFNPTTPYLPSIKIGGNLYYQKNYFYNSTSAIDMVHASNIFIMRNIIDYPSNPTPDHQVDFAISSKYNLYSPIIEIIENEIDNVVRGIYIGDANEIDELKINSNNISLTNTEGNTAIFLDDADVTVKAEIINNTITKAVRGIIVNMGQAPNIERNNITLNNTIYSSFVPNYGIGLFDVSSLLSNAQVHYNIISSNSMTSNTMVNGIASSITIYRLPFTCNEIEKTGTALHFAGVINNSLSFETPIYGNEMDYNYNGLVLTNNTELWEVGSLTLPSDNQWLANNTNFHTYTDGADGNLTTLFTRGGGLPYQPTNNGGIDPLIINNNATGSYFDCSSGIVIPPGDGFLGGMPDFDAMYASDTIAWLAQYNFYRALPNDSLIRDRSILQFKDSVDLSPLGRLLKLQQADSSYTLTQRSGLVKGLITNNAQEANLKTVMDYRISARLYQWDTLETTVLADLEQLANACPFEAGPAVYNARGLLMRFVGKQYYNACEGYTTTSKAMLRLKSPNNSTEEMEYNLALYPNPAKELLNVSLNLNAEDKGIMQIIDVKGRVVQEFDLSNGRNEIKLNQFSSGLYIYHVQINGEIVKTDKLIVQ